MRMKQVPDESEVWEDEDGAYAVVPVKQIGWRKMGWSASAGNRLQARNAIACPRRNEMGEELEAKRI